MKKHIFKLIIFIILLNIQTSVFAKCTVPQNQLYTDNDRIPYHDREINWDAPISSEHPKFQEHKKFVNRRIYEEHCDQRLQGLNRDEAKMHCVAWLQEVRMNISVDGRGVNPTRALMKECYPKGIVSKQQLRYVGININ